ncbi:MAG: hypothetical protein OEV94_10220 [Deltaproteobacteria bacterium]|nr:hypothetical protein [Deltaproteobacteria bacterium]MDH4122067.1 hypothetical protein [Deltaproteobacteria bacterium]
MTIFLTALGMVALTGVIYFLRAKARTAAGLVGPMLKEAEGWLTKNNLTSDAVWYTAYSAPGMARTLGATVMVGTSQDHKGQPVGFALEVLPGRGVMAGVMLAPYNIVAHHEEASFRARQSGQPLLDVFQVMAARFRAGLANTP